MRAQFYDGSTQVAYTLSQRDETWLSLTGHTLVRVGQIAPQDGVSLDYPRVPESCDPARNPDALFDWVRGYLALIGYVPQHEMSMELLER